jgi:hypothetical protein
MDRTVAIWLMGALRTAEPNLGSLSMLSAKISDGPRKRQIVKRIGKVMSSYVHMTMLIVGQHPELDPDREDAQALCPSRTAAFPPSAEALWTLPRSSERPRPAWKAWRL